LQNTSLIQEGAFWLLKEKVGIISLGCSKNRVDTEIMLGYLQERGYQIVNRPEKADVLIVNTCGFIGPAKEESIEAILEMANYKKTGNCKVLLVTGCLSERYRDDMFKELPEVDGFLGVNNYREIGNVIEETLNGKRVTCFDLPNDNIIVSERRVLTTPSYTAYIKIAEGCDNCCTYCIIPKIRGPYYSRPMESILEEASDLANKGVKEIILIAQDTTRYGEDLYGKNMLPDLIRKLCRIEKIHWIRSLYSYPEKISDELLEVIQSEPKVCNYLDIPIQHIDDTILKRMNRQSSAEGIRSLIGRIHQGEADFILRTTLIVGFPGEDETAFHNLLQFVQEYPFDRMGVFSYSQEEGTLASEFPDQIPEATKQERYNTLMELQKKISFHRNEARIGKTYEVLIEGRHGNGLYVGRSYGEAPEIDGKIYIKSGETLSIGSFVPVRITKAYDYDLLGEVIHESRE